VDKQIVYSRRVFDLENERAPDTHITMMSHKNMLLAKQQKQDTKE
jgi:hypothetical protein